jgi:hypothetical protein
MPINGTVQATGEFAPSSTGDTYAILDTRYLRGGLHHVDTLTDLNSITTDRREVGMIASVSGTSYYKLAPEPWSYTLSDWTTFLDGNDIYVTGATLNTGYTLSLNRNDNNSVTVNLAGLASDVYVVSGVYDDTTGIVTFTNSTGGTFTVTGFVTGMTSGDYIRAWKVEKELGDTVTIGKGVGKLLLTNGSNVFSGTSGVNFTNQTNFDSPFFYYEATVILDDGTRRYISLNNNTGSTIGDIYDIYLDNNYINSIGNVWTGITGEYEYYPYFIPAATGELSHAEGYRNNASGDYSHAEGKETTASGVASHAEGNTSKALGAFSHAEGYQNIALGNFSHAEGNSTTAVGEGTHAEGQQTTASAIASHAEGQSTIASSDFSHAEGYLTISSGKTSHAEGYYNLAAGQASNVSGRGNMAFGGFDRAAGNFNIAGGVMNYFIFGPTSNCYDYASRTMYVRGDMTSKVASGDTIYWAHSDNQAIYVSTVASTPVYTDSGINTVASFFTYSGYTSIEITIDPTGGVNDTWAFEWGYLATDFNQNPEDFWTSHSAFVDGSSSYAYGDNTSAKGYYTRATAGHAEGAVTSAGGVGAHAEGWGTKATGNGSHSEGYATQALGNSSHAEGSGTLANNSNAHAEGNSTTASGVSSHAEGWGTKATGDTSHAEGENTLAFGYASHAEGYYTTANEFASHAEGWNTFANWYYTHAEGFFTTASGEGAHAEGYGSIASGPSSHAQNDHTTASGFASHAEGNITTAFGQYSHSENDRTKAFGDGSHAGGSLSIASGATSFVHGVNSIAIGTTTIVLGSNITGSTDNTTYVDNLNIKTLGAGASVVNLGIDSNGNVVTGSTGSSGSFLPLSGGTMTGSILFESPTTTNQISSTGFGYLSYLNLDPASPVGELSLYNTGFTSGSSIQVGEQQILVTSIQPNFFGIVYNQDYSPYYTNNSLITYGDLTAATSNLSLSAVTAVGNTTTDDIEITDSTKGIILRSPDNTRWRVTVDNSGSLITTIVP